MKITADSGTQANFGEGKVNLARKTMFAGDTVHRRRSSRRPDGEERGGAARSPERQSPAVVARSGRGVSVPGAGMEGGRTGEERSARALLLLGGGAPGRGRGRRWPRCWAAGSSEGIGSRMKTRREMLRDLVGRR